MYKKLSQLQAKLEKILLLRIHLIRWGYLTYFKKKSIVTYDFLKFIKELDILQNSVKSFTLRLLPLLFATPICTLSNMYKCTPNKISYIYIFFLRQLFTIH